MIETNEVGDQGEIEEVESPRHLPGGPGFSPEEHRAKTAKLMAMLFFIALCVVFAAHFGSILYLARNRPDSIEAVTRVFTGWTPIFSTLVGSAATFYFTQDRK
jgi:peptidoglycan biosynthesis protein MviN/MurJ (putative lipid II flippase)